MPPRGVPSYFPLCHSPPSLILRYRYLTPPLVVALEVSGGGTGTPGPALTIKPWVTSSLNLTPLWKTSPQHLMTTVGRSLIKSLTSALGASSPLSWVSPMALPPTSSTSPLAPSFLQVMNGRWRLNTSNGTALCLVTLVLFSALPLTPSRFILLM